MLLPGIWHPYSSLYLPESCQKQVAQEYVNFDIASRWSHQTILAGRRAVKNRDPDNDQDETPVPLIRGTAPLGSHFHREQWHRKDLGHTLNSHNGSPGVA